MQRLRLSRMCEIIQEHQAFDQAPCIVMMNFLYLSLVNLIMLKESLDSSQTWETYQTPSHHFLTFSEVQRKGGTGESWRSHLEWQESRATGVDGQPERLASGGIDAEPVKGSSRGLWSQGKDLRFHTILSTLALCLAHFTHWAKGFEWMI